MLRKFLISLYLSILTAGFVFFFVQRPSSLQRFVTQLFPTPVPKVTTIKGIGIIGDSLSDEYRSDDARGYEFGPTTLNWVEQLVKNRNLNFGSWGTWGDIRRTGFAYNWAHTGATTQSMLTAGQNTGVAQQVKNGDVNIVIIYIGANDFFPFNESNEYRNIYYASLEGQALNEKITVVASNIETAVTTVQEAGPVHIMLVTVPDWNLYPPVQVAFPNAEGRQRVSRATQAVNNKLTIFAKKKNLALVDVNTFYRELIAGAPLGSIKVGGESVNLYIPGDEPHQGFLSDIVHPGTILNGLFANYVLEHMNKKIGTSVTLLDEYEMLNNAGLTTR